MEREAECPQSHPEVGGTSSQAGGLTPHVSQLRLGWPVIPQGVHPSKPCLPILHVSPKELGSILPRSHRRRGIYLEKSTSCYIFIIS